MPVTPVPNPDKREPANETEREAAERAAFPGGGLDEWEPRAARIYNTNFMGPYGRAVIERAKSGHWGLGTTQEGLSSRLGITSDRGWVSRALHKGNLPFPIFVRLRFLKGLPADWEPDVKSLDLESQRCASMGIARAIARRLTVMRSIIPEFLHELNYELGCDVIKENSAWPGVESGGDFDGAVEFVQKICLPGDRNIRPDWYTDVQRRQVDADIKRLTSNGRLAFERLNTLSRSWRGVLAATAYVVEGIQRRLLVQPFASSRVNKTRQPKCADECARFDSGGSFDID